MTSLSIKPWAFMPKTWVVLALLFGAAGAAQAQIQVLPVQEANLESLRAEAQRWVQASMVQYKPEGETLRMEAQVGALDSRLHLAVCGNVEAYLPPGSRLWGRSRVGLRCVDGVSRWNVTLPVVVKAMGKSWVMRGTVMAGAPVTDADVMAMEVDWAENPSAVLAKREMWVGQTATRQLTTGQTLRQGMVKPTQVFQAGASVRVLASGPGFQVSSEAQALSAGVIGEQARVRMDNGRVTTGEVVDGRTVKIEL